MPNTELFLYALQAGIEKLEDLERRLGKQPRDDHTIRESMKLMHDTGKDVYACIDELHDLKLRIENERKRTFEHRHHKRPLTPNAPTGIFRIELLLD